MPILLGVVDPAHHNVENVPADDLMLLDSSEVAGQRNWETKLTGDSSEVALLRAAGRRVLTD